jgi:hypothetical protein
MNSWFETIITLFLDAPVQGALLDKRTVPQLWELQ